MRMYMMDTLRCLVSGFLWRVLVIPLRFWIVRYANIRAVVVLLVRTPADLLLVMLLIQVPVVTVSSFIAPLIPGYLPLLIIIPLTPLGNQTGLRVVST